MKKMGITILALMGLVMMSGTASASLTITGSTGGYSASLMDSFTVFDSSHTYIVNDGGSNLAANTVTLSPAYSDLTTPMTGTAGATGRWNALQGAYVYVDLGVTGISEDYSGSGLTEIKMFAFNDNDDTWGHRLWFETAADGFVLSSYISLDQGESATLTLDLTGLDLSDVTGYGVSIDSVDYNGGDAFHSSWSAVPEPASVICWGLMASAGGFGFVRNRRKQKKA